MSILKVFNQQWFKNSYVIGNRFIEVIKGTGDPFKMFRTTLGSSKVLRLRTQLK